MHHGRSREIALIGFGAIGREIAAQLLAAPEVGRLTTVLVRAARVGETRAALPGHIRVVSDVEGLAAAPPGIVLEAAGHAAVRDYGPALLRRGAELVLVSSGALADEALLETLLDAARAGGGRITVAAGAIAGLDGLGTLKAAGLTSVLYTSTKPPAAWRGTPAEKAVDLEALAGPAILFEGSAREAARAFPKNANVAATVALAGLGLDETRVRLVADPGARGNTGRIEAEGAAGRLDLVMSARPSANPKTSATTAFAVLHLLRVRQALLAV